MFALWNKIRHFDLNMGLLNSSVRKYSTLLTSVEDGTLRDLLLDPLESERSHGEKVKILCVKVVKCQ